MLDKDLPYMHIIMKAKKERIIQLPTPVLPEGYSFHMYKSGDEIAWAELETSVGEFDTFEDALTYFNRVFIPFQETLHTRMCFIVNEAGKFVSTATAWFKEDTHNHYSVLHWVSTSPDEQGKGLGKSITQYALTKFKTVEANESDIFLHTQTWSYTAICIYALYGFKITRTPLLEESTDFACLDVLKTVIPTSILDTLVE